MYPQFRCSMRHIVLTLSAALLLPQGLKAETVDFLKGYHINRPGLATSVTKGPDGHFYLTGASQAAGHTGTNVPFVIKTTALGDTLWTRSFPASGFSAIGYKVMAGPSHTLLVAANARDAFHSHALLFALDTTGEMIWQRSFELPGKSNAITDMLVVPGGLLLCGFITDQESGDQDGWLVRTDTAGMVLWEQQFGGPLEDGLASMLPAAGGGVLLGGWSYSFRTGDSGDDCWLVRADSLGGLIWQQHYGHANTGDYINHMAPLGDAAAPAGYVFTGAGNSNEDDFSRQGMTARIDTNGGIAWTILHPAEHNLSEGMVVIPVSGNNCHVMGSERIGEDIRMFGLHLDAAGHPLDTTYILDPDAGALWPHGAFVDEAGAVYIAAQQFHIRPIYSYPALLRISGINHEPTGIYTTGTQEPLTISSNPATDAVTAATPQ